MYSPESGPNLDPHGTSRAIHDRVTDLLQSALSIYRIDLEQLFQLQPTHIITQAQCEVCAVSLADVKAAIAQWSDYQSQVISLTGIAVGFVIRLQLVGFQKIAIA